MQAAHRRKPQPKSLPKLRKKPPPKKPLKDLLPFERGLISKGLLSIAGVDEVGRGCLAGPVFAAAVILPPGCFLPEVDDSKKLKPATRDRLFDLIQREAIAWTVAFVDAAEIDRINIHHASLKAMRLAVEALDARPDYLLIDGKFTLSAGAGAASLLRRLPQEAVIAGDARSQTIAAASIVAKVTRDRWISEEGKKYPEYNFTKHKGYGTKEHREAIRRHGLTPLHRRSFKSF